MQSIKSLVNPTKRVKVSFQKSRNQTLEMYVNLPINFDMSDKLEVNAVTKDFLNQCAKQFCVTRGCLRHIFKVQERGRAGVGEDRCERREQEGG